MIMHVGYMFRPSQKYKGGCGEPNMILMDWSENLQETMVLPAKYGAFLYMLSSKISRMLGISQPAIGGT